MGSKPSVSLITPTVRDVGEPVVALELPDEPDVDVDAVLLVLPPPQPLSRASMRLNDRIRLTSSSFLSLLFHLGGTQDGVFLSIPPVVQVPHRVFVE